MMGDNNGTKLKSDDELEYGLMMGAMWDELQGDS